MNEAEMNWMIHQHKLWLKKEDGGKKLSVSNTSLYGCDLAGKDLRLSIFSNVDFRGAKLCDCNFEQAELHGCNFQHTDLSGMNLFGANCEFCNFFGAEMGTAKIGGAELWNVTGDGKRIFTFRVDPFPVVVMTKYLMWVGKECALPAQWWDQDQEMECLASYSHYWGLYKPLLKEVYRVKYLWDDGN